MPSTVTFEGKAVNLHDFESYHIEEHTTLDGQFYVKGTWTRRAGATGYTENLFQGTEDECKAFFRDEIAEKIGLSGDEQYFAEFFGPPKPAAKKTAAKTTEQSEAE